jgi:CopA family copper-resistance protein
MSIDRRRLIRSAANGALALGASGLLPAWARSASDGNLGIAQLTGRVFDLTVSKFPVRIGGRAGDAVGVNGTIPAPLLRFREGDEITINVANALDEDTSIHWHGLLVPFYMDGVPGVSFPGIRPGETFQYKFAVPQNGTYWYHSHSGLQEQIGHYGPIVIDPKGADPVAYDREYVLVLSDWSFTDPDRIFAKLKKVSHSFNFQERTFPDFIEDASENGLRAAFRQRAMWGEMRMSPRDIADVTGATYRYLINGHATADNWNGIFQTGERIRLRIINASAMTIFNVRIPGLPMTVVQSDGLNVEPIEIDEFQIGVAETYDVIVTPKEERAYAFVAESVDRSGQAVATFGPRPGMRAEAPALRQVPTLTMVDMGMASHAGHGSAQMGGAGMEDMDHGAMTHDAAVSGDSHAGMDHGNHGVASHAAASLAAVKRGPGIDMIAMEPVSRLGEPGAGLAEVGHRTLRYAQLRSLDPTPDTRPPGREIELHLTGNMERYMWSFDGVKFSEVDKPIVFNESERVRLTMINDTMMAHPIHLHGMFFDLVIPVSDAGEHDQHRKRPASRYAPRKHTVVVKPGEKLSVDVTADAVGDWAFHCHMLYHMMAGMMQVVSVLPRLASNEHGHDMSGHQNHDGMDHGPMKHDASHEEMDHSKMNHGEAQ